MTNNQRFDFFIKKCKENIHLALTFSPVGEVFRKRLRTFPSLINCTTIDWFLPWPKSALESVSKSLLNSSDEDGDKLLDLSKINKISNIFVAMQGMVTNLSTRYFAEHKKHFYVTPKTYLELIDYFKRSLGKNIQTNENNINRYLKGLEKLKGAADEVETKKAELEVLQPQLKVSSKEIDELIITVQKEQVIADAKKINCEAEEVECNKDRDTANTLKDNCKKEVEKLEPLLIRALKNLEGVSRADIDFIKSTRSPSPALVALFKSLCILYGFREGKEVKMKKDEKPPYKKFPDYFECARKLIMNKPNVMINTLKSYKESKINEMDTNIIKKWQKMIDTEPQFNEDKLNRTSEAAGKIFNWVTCIIDVYHALQEINPLRDKLANAVASLKNAE